MLSQKDTVLVYETLLSSPGMTTTVKISVALPRKTLLLLTKVIEHGITMKDEKVEGSILSSMDEETLSELKNICATLLDIGGLSEMNMKLNSLTTK